MKMPTRIISKERMATGHTGQPSYHYTCDNGCTYTSEELGRILGLNPWTVRDRVREYGLRSPVCLMNQTQLRQYRAAQRQKKIAQMDERLSTIPAGDLAHLSDAPRAKNLRRITRPGIWERQNMGQSAR